MRTIQEQTCQNRILYLAYRFNGGGPMPTSVSLQRYAIQIVSKLPEGEDARTILLHALEMVDALLEGERAGRPARPVLTLVRSEDRTTGS